MIYDEFDEFDEFDELSLPADTDVRLVSEEESMSVLERPTAAGLPTSVLPFQVQEKLNKGEQILASEMVPVPISASHESG